jgi:hypothetical protein
MITNAGQVYDLANLLIERSSAEGLCDIAQKLDDAMHLGSSALEILGAIRQVLVDDSGRITKLVDKGDLDEAIQFVSRTYG